MPPKNEVNHGLATAIAASGIRVETVDEYPLNSIKGALQVRADQTDSDAHLNAGKVSEYKAKFLAGTTPPPIGVTRDGILIFGNHRVGAARDAGRADLPAMVFDVDGVDPDEHTRSLLTTFSGRENASHGLPLSPKDKDLVIRREVALGTTNGTIQAIYGVSAGRLSGLKREIEAEKRLSDLGISRRAQGRDRSVIRALSGPSARAITNQPFKDLVDLVVDADLKVAEINEIAAAARAAGTEDGAIKVIADKRAELAKQIQEVEASGQRERPTPLTRLRKAVAEVNGLCEKFEPSHYRDYTGDVEETKSAIRAAVSCLNNILAAQEA